MLIECAVASGAGTAPAGSRHLMARRGRGDTRQVTYAALRSSVCSMTGTDRLGLACSGRAGVSRDQKRVEVHCTVAASSTAGLRSHAVITEPKTSYVLRYSNEIGVPVEDAVGTTLSRRVGVTVQVVVVVRAVCLVGDDGNAVTAKAPWSSRLLRSWISTECLQVL
jgi:hypothetical protein